MQRYRCKYHSDFYKNCIWFLMRKNRIYFNWFQNIAIEIGNATEISMMFNYLRHIIFWARLKFGFGRDWSSRGSEFGDSSLGLVKPGEWTKTSRS